MALMQTNVTLRRYQRTERDEQKENTWQHRGVLAKNEIKQTQNRGFTSFARREMERLSSEMSIWCWRACKWTPGASKMFMYFENCSGNFPPFLNCNPLSFHKWFRLTRGVFSKAFSVELLLCLNMKKLLSCNSVELRGCELHLSTKHFL